MSRQTRKTREAEPLPQSESDELDTGLQAVTLQWFRHHWLRAFPGQPVPKVFGESYRAPIAIPSPADQAMLCKVFHCEPAALKKMTLSEITDRLRVVAAAISANTTTPKYGPGEQPRVFFVGHKPKTITVTSWRFLRAVWGKPQVPFVDVGEAVWGGQFTAAATIRSRASRVSDELYKLGITLELRCDGECVSPLTPWPE